MTQSALLKAREALRSLVSMAAVNPCMLPLEPAREAIADLDRAISEDGWLPIETAPISTPLKQKWFWAYSPDATFGYGQDQCQHLCVRYGFGFKVIGSANDRYPTHWMPLPAPPIATENASQEVGK